MCFSTLQKFLWRKGKGFSTCPQPACLCCPWRRAEGWRERTPIHTQAGSRAAPQTFWAAAVPTTGPRPAYSGRIYKSMLKCTPGWGPACWTAAEALPQGLLGQRLWGNMGLPSLACPPTFHTHQTEARAKIFPPALLCPWSLCTILLPPAPCTTIQCHPAWPKDSTLLTRASRDSGVSRATCKSKASGFGPEDGDLQVSVFIPPATVL